MFWGKKNKNNKTDKRNNKSCAGREGQRKSREDIQAEALANARAARDNLGDDTIQKISEIMKKMENSPMAQAQKQLANADPDKVLDELKWMLDQKKN